MTPLVSVIVVLGLALVLVLVLAVKLSCDSTWVLHAPTLKRLSR